jgi:osmotically-inducible protein OsmY
MAVTKRASLAWILVAAFPLAFADVPASIGKTDAELTAQVHKLLLSHTALRWKNIQVTTKEGVVHLLGVVQSLDEREHADRYVRAIPGVVSVKNDLTVGDGGH